MDNAKSTEPSTTPPSALQQRNSAEHPTDRRALLAGIGGLAAGAFLAGAKTANAGPLNPPPGPIAPTPGPEPRIPLNQQTAPGSSVAMFNITSAGSYYLTANILGSPGMSAIRIFSSGVTLDLMGFELFGGDGSVNAVATATGGLQNVAICNGIIRNWTTGINLAGPVAVLGGRVERVHTSDCSDAGLRVGDDFIVTHCTATRHGAEGMSAQRGCIISECTSNLNQIGFNIALGNTITRCIAERNRGFGIRAGSDNMITHNKILNNRLGMVSAGIDIFAQGNYIEGNNIILEILAINAPNGNNVIVRNSFRAADIVPSHIAINTFGPVINSSQIANNSNPHANYAY